MAFIPKNNGASRRFLAATIDGIALGIVLLPLSVGIPLLTMAFVEENSSMAMIMAILNFVIQWGAIALIYGWFYKNKGATPGKLLLNLQVLDANTGTRIGYGKAFLRDLVGKFLSAITLFIGYAMIWFRDDRRCLHDLIAGTHVVYIEKDKV